MAPMISGNPRRRSLLWLMGLALLLAFAFQGSRGLWSTDEGRYVDGALQMVDSGNYLVPAYSPIEVNLSKPPVTYWVIATAVKWLGRNTWATRLPWAFAFVATVWLLYGMGLRLVPGKPWLPGLVYALSLPPFIAANVVNPDTLLTLCEALAMYGFVAWRFAPDRSRARAWLALMWLGWGLAFLTKGPPGLLPLLAVIPFLVIRDGWRGAGRLFTLPGLALFLLAGFGWYAVVVLRVPWALHYFLHYEVYDRIFTSVQHRNPGPWGWALVYLPTLILGTLPWWPALAFARLVRKWKPLPDAPPARADVSLLLWLWFAIPFLVFCLAQSRLPAYVLPLFLPLSLLLALGLERWIDLRKALQWLGLAVWIVALLVLKGGVAYAVKQPHRDNRLIAAQLSKMVDPLGYSAVVFVEATDSGYNIEERTPWGIRLYLDKPVYAVAWFAPAGPAQLCKALRRSGSALVVTDPGLHSGHVLGSLLQCTPTRVNAVGQWQGHAVTWVRS